MLDWLERPGDPPIARILAIALGVVLLVLTFVFVVLTIVFA